MKILRSLLLPILVALSLWSQTARAVTMLVKNGSTPPIEFLLVDSTTGQTGQTGKAGSTTIFLSKNGATGAASAGTITEIDSTNLPGIYSYTPTATETNTNGLLALHITCTGCQTQDYTVQIISFDPNDAVRLGLSSLPNAAASSAGGLPTLGTGAGQINVDGLGNVSLSAANSPIIQTGTAQGGTSNTITLAVGAASVSSLYNLEICVIIGGTGAGQARLILGYSGGSKIATVGRSWTVTPDNTSVYVIRPWDGPITDSNGYTTSNGVQGSMTGTAGGISGVAFPPTVPSLAQILGGFSFDGSNNIKASVYAYNTGLDPATEVLGATGTTWNTAGTVGHELFTAGSAGDPWATQTSAETGAGTFGVLVKKLMFDGSNFLEVNPQVDSPGVTTLLGRVPNTVPTAAQIVTQLLATSINGHTYQDILATLNVYHQGNATVVKSGASPWTITVTYTDNAVTYTVVSTFTDNTFSTQTARTVTITGLP